MTPPGYIPRDASESRQDYIDEILFVVGFTNRSHLMRRFKISTATAAKDFRIARKRWGPQLHYDANSKHFHLKNGREA